MGLRFQVITTMAEDDMYLALHDLIANWVLSPSLRDIYDTFSVLWTL